MEMENAHPVPQNVTSFEFHLIGDMTLKQFIYLGSGAGLAYLVFVFLAAPAPVLAWPIIIFSAFMGIAFAFIPIADRPLDHWLNAFLKAIYSPTKRAWKKDSKLFKDDPLFNNRLNIYLSNQPAPIESGSAPIPPKPAQPQPVQQPSEPVVAAPTTPPATSQKDEPLPTTEELTKTVELANQAQSLQVKMIEAEREMSQIKASAEANPNQPQAYTQQFNSVFNNLQKLVAEATDVKAELANLTKQSNTARPDVKIEVVPVPKPKPTQTQIILTSVPNVINGIVTDHLGNYLDNAVVVIHDKEGLPVRAVKTNKLGQFSGSTPLPNGTYNIELEKDGSAFDVLQINLDGKVLAPINIAAKKI